MTHSIGIEIETCNKSVDVVRRALRDANIKGWKVTPDGTPRVDAEIISPVLASCDFAYNELKKVCRVLADIGCGVNTACGLHVHVSNAFHNESATNFCGSSIAHTESTGRFYSNHCEPLAFDYWKDVSSRYTTQQSIMNSLFPRSRTSNRYCLPLTQAKIDRASTIQELNHGKFYAINFSTWSKGTVEFRQHSGTIEADKIWNWVQFVLNLVNHTVENRFTEQARTIVQTTPVQPFRNGSRIGVQYNMMRTANGTSTQDIMNATGCSEQRVRASVSEIRSHREVGQQAVVTHTQQSNGASYGDGTNHTRYQVLESLETQTSGATLLPENTIGQPSVWANLSDELFEFWNERIISLRSRA